MIGGAYLTFVMNSNSFRSCLFNLSLAVPKGESCDRPEICNNYIRGYLEQGGGDYADDLLSDAQLSDSIFLDINKFPDA